jgi:hypothetical protein
MFADKNVYTFLTQSAYALGACIAVSQYREFPASGAVDLYGIKRGRRRIRKTL